MKSPLSAKLLMCTNPAELLVMVMVWKALVVPTGAVNVVIAVGVTVTGALPEPVSGMDCGLPCASSVTTRVAVLVPDAVGLNTTLIGQIKFAGRDAGTVGQELVTEKSPESAPPMAIDEIFNPTPWLFVRVTV